MKQASSISAKEYKTNSNTDFAETFPTQDLKLFDIVHEPKHSSHHGYHHHSTHRNTHKPSIKKIWKLNEDEAPLIMKRYSKVPLSFGSDVKEQVNDAISITEIFDGKEAAEIDNSSEKNKQVDSLTEKQGD